MSRTLMTILAAVATSLSGTAGAACILVDGSTADRGACRYVWGETRYDDGIGDYQSLDYLNSIYSWSSDDVSFETWHYGADASRDDDGASLSAFTTVELWAHSEPPASVPTSLGTATYRGHSIGVYALATSLGANVGAARSNVELTADFTEGELTGTFDRFSILLQAATGDGWQRIPASITVAGELLKDGLAFTSSGFSVEDGVVGLGQLDSDFILPGNSTTWRVKRNQVFGLTPELPDLPEFSVEAAFVTEAAKVIGTVATINPLTVERGDSTGLLSLSMSFGADTATMPAPELTPTLTLAGAIPDPANTFKAASRMLHVDNGSNRVSVTDRFAIESVGSDGDGGYHVTYVVDGARATVHFSRDDSESPYGYSKEVGGVAHYFWSYTGSFNAEESSEFRYFRAIGSSFWDVSWGARGAATYGVPTSLSGMPSGTAKYGGRMGADAFDNTVDFSEGTNVARTRMQGKVVLTADFADATLAGRIFRLRVKGPDASSYEDLPSTTRFEITDGEIADGQFTASLNGVDDDPSAPLNESVRGYEGSVLGEFHGPTAEEVGGVLNAARAEGDDDDWAVHGWFGGSRLIEYKDAEAFSSGVDRHDYSSANPRIASQAAGNKVTGVEVAVAESGVNEYTIHYRANGVDRSLSLGADKLGASASFPSAYFEQDDGWGYLLLANPAGTYYNVSSWFRTKFPNEDYDNSEIDFAQASWLVHGSRTPQAGMPTAGTATYAGSAAAHVWIPSPGQGRASSVFAERYRGDLTLSADFAEGAITGRIDGLEHRMTSRDPYQAVSEGSFTIAGGTISGNGLSGSLEGLGYSGTVEGTFYGPTAEEAAGVMQATGPEGKLLHGQFGGARQ